MTEVINVDEYFKLVPLSETELQERNVSPRMMQRLQHIRGLYAYWLQFPTKTNREIVEYAIKMFGLKKSQAYDDLHLTQILLGNLQQASKNFMRWKINQDLEHDLIIARRKGDLRAVASIEKNRILNNRTDKEDEAELEYDKIVPQVFEPTDDPTVIGIKRVTGLRERIKKLEKKYRGGIEDAVYEEVNDNGDEPTD